VSKVLQEHLELYVDCRGKCVICVIWKIIWCFIWKSVRYDHLMLLWRLVMMSVNEFLAIFNTISVTSVKWKPVFVPLHFRSDRRPWS